MTCALPHLQRTAQINRMRTEQKIPFPNLAASGPHNTSWLLLKLASLWCRFVVSSGKLQGPHGQVYNLNAICGGVDTRDGDRGLSWGFGQRIISGGPLIKAEGGGPGGLHLRAVRPRSMRAGKGSKRAPPVCKACGQVCNFVNFCCQQCMGQHISD